MKLSSREQIESLSKFRSDSLLTTSLYLDTDKSRMTKKEIRLSLKNLLSGGKARLDKMDISKEKKESLIHDLEKIRLFSSQNLSSYNFAGLAQFSCHNKEFWQTFNLPSPPRNRIVFDKNPYVRPLSAILGEHRRICTLAFDRREAKWYEVFMGEISLLEGLIEDVPKKVREGGWEGYESKRIERHIATHLHEHFKNIALITFDFFKKNNFDWFFIGCKEKHYSNFEPLLHPYLKNKLKGRIKSMPNASLGKVLAESAELEKKLKTREEEDSVQSYVSELEKGGKAVSTLKRTLRSLNRGEVQTLFITRYFSKPGRTCPRCHFLFVDEARCPSCQIKTEPLLDIIDEAVEAAMDKKCQVKHINSPSKLDRYGKIGAFLRYKI